MKFNCLFPTLALFLVCSAFGQLTNPPVTSFSNAVQVVSAKPDGDRIPAVTVGPFMLGGGHEPNKDASQVVLISLLKVLIWPGVFVFIVYFFNRDIRSLLGKVKSVKAKDYGVEMAPDERLSDQQKASANPPVPPIASAVNHAGGALEFEKAKANAKITPAMEPIVVGVRESVEKSPFTPEQKIELGIVALSRVALAADFWRIYNFVFGSQLQLLQFMNSRPTLSPAELDAFFSNVSQNFPDTYKASNSKEYSSFLLTNGLINHDGSHFFITAKGKEFLLWCIESNLGFNKPL